MAKKGRRQKARVHSPVDNTTVLPYARIDASGNYYFSWKDEKGKWRKRNLGRGDGWYQRYLQCEAELIQKEPYVSFSDIELPQITTPEQIDVNLLAKDLRNIDELVLAIDENSDLFISAIKPKIERSVMVKWAKDLIHNNPRKASELFEIPYERLVGISVPKNYTLKEIGENYFTGIKFQGVLDTYQKNEIRKMRQSWDRFCKVTDCKTVAEVDQQHVKYFYDDVYGEFKRRGLSTTWLRGYFERVRRIINAAIRDLPDCEHLREMQRICSNKLRTRLNVVNNPPYRIKKKEFFQLLKHSDLEQQAMWMLSMNCAYYSVDVATVPLSAIDFDEKTIIYRRTKHADKNKGKRAAILWDETISLLQKYLASKRHIQRETVFVSRFGKPYVRGRIRKKFEEVRRKAKLPHIVHANFRDSVETIGHRIPGIQNSVDAVLGQNPDYSRGNYIDPEGTPELAADCCEAVHDFYFG